MAEITIWFYDYIFICDGEIIEQDFYDKETGDIKAKAHAKIYLTKEIKKLLQLNY